MDEHDLKDPHGEAEELRRENARLRAELMAGRATRWVGAYRQLDAAIARAEAAEAALHELTQPTALRVLPTYTSANATDKAPLAASRAPDPVANAGSCQPGDLISRAAAIEAVTLADKACLGAMGAREAIRAIPAAQVADAQTVAEKFHDTYERLAPSFGYETRPDTKRFDPESPNGKLMIAVCEAALSDLAKMKGE